VIVLVLSFSYFIELRAVTHHLLKYSTYLLIHIPMYRERVTVVNGVIIRDIQDYDFD